MFPRATLEIPPIVPHQIFDSQFLNLYICAQAEALFAVFVFKVLVRSLRW